LFPPLASAPKAEDGRRLRGPAKALARKRALTDRARADLAAWLGEGTVPAAAEEPVSRPGAHAPTPRPSSCGPGRSATPPAREPRGGANAAVRRLSGTDRSLGVPSGAD